MNKCCITNCKSRKRVINVSDHNNKVTYHKLPHKNRQLLKRWMIIINQHQKDFIPTKGTRICSLHFVSLDFKTESTDSNTRRRRKRNTKLKLKHLRCDAVPSILPFSTDRSNSTNSNSQRTKRLAFSSSRLEAENERLIELEKQVFDEDTVKDIYEISNRLKCCNHKPHGFIHSVMDCGLLILLKFLITSLK